MSSPGSAKRERRFHALGWSCFLMSSLVYMAASFRVDDMVGLLGGFLFFLACMSFIITFLYAK